MTTPISLLLPALPDPVEPDADALSALKILCIDLAATAPVEAYAILQRVRTLACGDAHRPEYLLILSELTVALLHRDAAPVPSFRVLEVAP